MEHWKLANCTSPADRKNIQLMNSRQTICLKALNKPLSQVTRAANFRGIDYTQVLARDIRRDLILLLTLINNLKFILSK